MIPAEAICAQLSAIRRGGERERVRVSVLSAFLLSDIMFFIVWSYNRTHIAASRLPKKTFFPNAFHINC